ncbi:hypothetical protein Zmor_005258 [Zophobas morio]|uniref:Centrosome-associated protein 350 n=1 Tax=Zophobas morio TaxID=2755281 RepID=A0AA38IP16_9CUCU|nr:hypothetical protein Zmor_005258 [Zophobas morio]
MIKNSPPNIRYPVGGVPEATFLFGSFLYGGNTRFKISQHSIQRHRRSCSLLLLSPPDVNRSKLRNWSEKNGGSIFRTLLMREAALQKRRKAAEELLRWHRKLLDEERKISELEAAATSVVRQEGPKDKYKFNGKQLNQLWRNMTGCDEKKFVEDKLYVMSQTTLERLCKSARQHSGRNKRPPKHERSNEMSGVSDANNYSSAFEPESVQEIISQEEKTKISSISELIDNFSRIEDEISTLSKKSEDIVSLKESSRVEEEIRFERDESEKTVPEESEASSKDVEDEETSVTEAVEESSIKLSPKDLVPKEEVEATPTPEQVSTKIEDLEEAKSIPEVSTTTEDQEEKLEEPSADKSVEEISTHKESEREIPSRPKDQDTIADQISKDTEETKHTQEIPSSLEKEDATNDDQLSINEDIEEPKSPEDQAIPSEHTSTKSLDLEEIQNLEELYPVHEVHLEEPSEHISTEDDKSTSGEEKSISKEEQPISEEKDAEVELSTKEEKLTSRISVEEVESDATPDEQTTVSTEEQPSTEGKAGFIEANFHEVETELSLEEALESAFKIEESLSKLNEKLISVKKDELSADSSSAKEVESVDETSNKTTSKSYTSSSVHTDVEEKTPDKKTNNQIDVKKRVSEILADASPTRGDKSPRLQDLYVTAYDVGATNSSEFTESYIDGRPLPPDIYGSEAEELRRKQLAIEQEIKQIELQQKEQLPYVFMREIPNKPPPPYTPPSSLSSISQTILPSEVKEINELACYSSKVLYKAYQNNNLDKVKFSENGFKLFSKVEVPKICAEYVFDICRDVARNHYKQFEKCEEPTWLATKKPQLTRNKPPDVTGLEKILNKKLKELFGFKKTQIAESAIIKWGRKKRDHVDEVLVIESQEEESQWTNFDKDELIVKNQVTDDIMKMLLEETAAVFAKIFSKKKVVGRACDKSE